MNVQAILGNACVCRRVMLIAVLAIAAFVPFQTSADTLWTPSVKLVGIQDDNILFSRDAQEDDYLITFEPGLRIDYNQEVTRISAAGSVYFRRYMDNDDLNDEVYNLNVDGTSNITERFRLRGGIKVVKDTTLDSELQETGRIYFRDDRLSQDYRLAPTFNLTERVSIGVAARYRNVAYDSDDQVDYTVWDFRLPLGYRLATQVDTIFLSPGYSYRDSDDRNSTSYNLRIGWDHQTTERLNLIFSIGARYTEHENTITDETKENTSALGELELNYQFQKGYLNLDFLHDLQNTASGDQVNVSRVTAELRWHFTEKTGITLNGRYVYSESDDDDNSDSSQYYEAGADLFYVFTENHDVFIGYDYSEDYQENIDDHPRVDRSRIFAGVRLRFPMK